MMSEAFEKGQFEQIEVLLMSVLEGVETHLNQENASQIREWIDVSEFGLAYERLFDTLPKDVSATIKHDLSVAGKLMGFEE